jgi:Glycosyltransferases involved in cell wall biogenesis
MSSVFIILPVYNESTTVLINLIHQLQELPYKIVIVDDGSDYPLRNTLIKYPITVIRHSINLGQGASIQTGFEYAMINNADYVVTFDADGQHIVNEIPTILEPLLNNQADVVLGSRFLAGAFHNASVRKTMAFKMAYIVNRFFIRKSISDTHNGFRAFNNEAIKLIRLTENKMAHATELIIQIRKYKLRLMEVPVSVHYTDYSRQKGQTWYDPIRIFFDLVLFKFFE